MCVVLRVVPVLGGGGACACVSCSCAYSFRVVCACVAWLRARSSLSSDLLRTRWCRGVQHTREVVLVLFSIATCVICVFFSSCLIVDGTGRPQSTRGASQRAILSVPKAAPTQPLVRRNLCRFGAGCVDCHHVTTSARGEKAKSAGLGVCFSSLRDLSVIYSEFYIYGFVGVASRQRSLPDCYTMKSLFYYYCPFYSVCVGILHFVCIASLAWPVLL